MTRQDEEICLLIEKFGELEEIIGSIKGCDITPLVDLVIESLREKYQPDALYKSRIQLPPFDRKSNLTKGVKIPNQTDMASYREFLIKHFIDEDFYQVTNYLQYEICLVSVPTPYQTRDGNWTNWKEDQTNHYNDWYGQ